MSDKIERVLNITTRQDGKTYESETTIAFDEDAQVWYVQESTLKGLHFETKTVDMMAEMIADDQHVLMEMNSLH